MDTDDIWEFEEFLSLLPMRAPKKYLRDDRNPFEAYTEKQFFRRYRFTKDIFFSVLLPLLGENNPQNRGLPISNTTKLLAALRFYATGSFQV